MAFIRCAHCDALMISKFAGMRWLPTGGQIPWASTAHMSNLVHGQRDQRAVRQLTNTRRHINVFFHQMHNAVDQQGADVDIRISGNEIRNQRREVGRPNTTGGFVVTLLRALCCTIAVPIEAVLRKEIDNRVVCLPTLNFQQYAVHAGADLHPAPMGHVLQSAEAVCRRRHCTRIAAGVEDVDINSIKGDLGNAGDLRVTDPVCGIGLCHDELQGLMNKRRECITPVFIKQIDLKMQSIDHFDLRSVDLNLLIALDAMMFERSVTRAAGRLKIRQPAMSHNLSVLRTVLDDELFARVGTRMRPTSRAQALA